MNIDLTTTYLGLPLKNPLIASASPLSRTTKGVRALEDAGVAAIVLHSLFAEQILMGEYFYAEGYGSGAGSFQETLSYFPRWDRDTVGPEGYLDEIRLAKRAVSIPIIASLNGAAPGEACGHAPRQHTPPVLGDPDQMHLQPDAPSRGAWCERLSNKQAPVVRHLAAFAGDAWL